MFRVPMVVCAIGLFLPGNFPGFFYVRNRMVMRSDLKMTGGGSVINSYCLFL